MRYITAFMIFLLWGILTIAMIVTLFGLLPLMENADEWFEIPTKCVKVFEIE